MIVAWKEDRLYRGMYAAMPLSEILDELGKRLDIELVKETFDRKMLGLKAALGKIEVDNIRERTLMGRTARLEKGEMIGSIRQVRYGYKKVQRRLEIEETEAGVIRQVFDWYIEGIHNVEMRRRLNASGVLPRRGKLWSMRTLHKILTCQAYATGQLPFVSNGVQFYIPCEPIISMATWQKAQEVRANNRCLPRRLKEDYLCVGLVYCICGRKCQARASQVVTPKKIYHSSNYICKTEYYPPEQRPSNCVRSIVTKKADDYVWNFVKQLCDRPEVLREAIAQRIATLEAEQGDLEAEAERLQKLLDELTMERQWVITQARKGNITEEDMNMQLGALQLQELGLQKELKEKKVASAVRSQTQALSEWAIQYLSEVGEGIKAIDVDPQILTPEECQVLAKELEAWRFAEKFPDDELAQLRWAILEERRRTVRTLISRVIVSRTDGPETHKITPVLALEIPQYLHSCTPHTWIWKAEQTGDHFLLRFVQTLHHWWHEILNYFEERITNGFVEGINRAIRLIINRAYGYRNFENFRLKILTQHGVPVLLPH